MKRVTGQRQWCDDIDLKDDYGYSIIYQRLAEYENTELTPDEILAMKENIRKLKNLVQKYQKEYERLKGE